MRKAVFRVSDKVRHNPCGTVHNHRRSLEAWKFGFRNFVFVYAKSRFSRDAAQIIR